MTETAIDTIETMLENAMAETDNSEIRFKLRTALQLLTAVVEQKKVAREALEDCEMEEELRQRLHDLGYISR